MTILVDNTVLSNFALVGRMDLLQLALGAHAATTLQVMKEFRAGADLGRFPTFDFDWLQVLPLTSEEETYYQHLLRRLNAGEAACLAIASHRETRLLTDDRDARALAGQTGIGISGTLGVLVQLTRDGHLTLAAADRLVTEMIQKGYHSPLETIKALL